MSEDQTHGWQKSKKGLLFCQQPSKLERDERYEKHAQPLDALKMEKKNEG
jgi:hypothetical protein